MDVGIAVNNCDGYKIFTIIYVKKMRSQRCFRYDPKTDAYNVGRFVEQVLMLSSYFRCDQFTNMRDIILVTLCCAT
jgi:hypothetical protein